MYCKKCEEEATLMRSIKKDGYVYKRYICCGIRFSTHVTTFYKHYEDDDSIKMTKEEFYER